MRTLILGLVAALGLSMGIAAPAVAEPTETQIIIFTVIPNPALVGPGSMIVLSSSGLPVTVAVDPSSDPGVCSVAYPTLTFNAVGVCKLTASQPGNDTFLPADPVTVTVPVTEPGGMTPQTITIDPPLPATATTPGVTLLSATSSSGLPVTFVVDPSSDPGVCSVGGNFLTYSAVGTCKVTATQPGNATFGPAPPVTTSIVVSLAGGPKVSQTITFDPPATGTAPGNAAVSATSSSGLPVTLNVDPSSDPDVCLVVPGFVLYNAAGTCTITATQPGDLSFDPAPPVTKSITITATTFPQTITFDPPATGTVGDSAVLVASSSSGLPVTLAVDPSSDAGVCSLSGATVSYVAAGSCTITAAQPGNPSFDPAPPVTKSITVSAVAADSDGDNVPDSSDNCPTEDNQAQTDTDTDGVGDACDNCPLHANSGQEDSDSDEVGDACESSSVSDFTTGPTATIDGTVRQGQTLSAGKGTPVPTPDSFTYQWLADGTDIGGATDQTFVLTAGQVGKKISVTVTAIKADYNSAADTSDETPPVQGIFSPGPIASIAGTLRTHATLTARRGSPSPTPTSFAYRWFANGKAISGATGNRFKLTSAQAGKKITVRVTAKKSGYVSASDVSAPTSTISALQAKELLLKPDEDSVRRRQKVDVEVARLSAKESWTLYFDKVKVGSGHASSKGTVKTTYTVPSSASAGKHTLKVVGRFADRTDSDTLKVK